MRAICNIGYGRHACQQLPPNCAADAVRFHISKDDGALIRIQYVFEKECWPAERGTIDYDVTRGWASGISASGGSASPVDGDILRRQAEAYLEHYLRRRDHA